MSEAVAPLRAPRRKKKKRSQQKKTRAESKKPSDFSSWSSVQRKSWEQKHSNPNQFYYRHLDEGLRDGVSVMSIAGEPLCR